MSSKTKHQPVHVDNATHKLIKDYAKAMGQPVTRAIAIMANDWIPTVGKAKIESNNRIRSEFNDSLSTIAQHAKVLVFGKDGQMAAETKAAAAATAGK